MFFSEKDEKAAWLELDSIAARVKDKEIDVSEWFLAYCSYLESRNIISNSRQVIYDMCKIIAEQ